MPAFEYPVNSHLVSRQSLVSGSQLSPESLREVSARQTRAAVSCGWSVLTVLCSLHLGSVADSGTDLVSSPTDEGGCCLVSVGSCLLLLPLLGLAGQWLTVSPHAGSLLLRHVGFPCPHALHLPWAGCVGFPPLPRDLDALVSSSLAFPAASMFSGSLAGVRLHSCSPSTCTAVFISCAGVSLSFLPLDTCT